MTFRLSTILLSLSLLFYLLAKQDLDLPAGALQASGMLFLLMGAIAGRYRPPPLMMLGALIGSSFLLVGWAVSGGPIEGMLNAVFILLSFPLALAAAASLRSRAFLWIAVLLVSGLCFLGIATGDISVSYIGDSRVDRWVLGFLRPTFLAEAMVLMVMALHGLRGHGVWRQLAWWLALLAVLAVQFKTGSRAGLGASIVFLFLAWENQLARGHRRAVRFATRGVVIIGLAWLGLAEWDVDMVDPLTTGRLSILQVEIAGNLKQPLHWLLGNSDAEAIFRYSTDREGLVYHIDSFYGERLVSSGLVGLAVIGLMAFAFGRSGNRNTHAALAAILFYGLFENGVFNVTSGFAAYSLVFAALLARVPDANTSYASIRQRARNLHRRDGLRTPASRG